MRFSKLDFYQRSVAVSLSALITVDMIGWGTGNYMCWPFLHAASACAIPEAVMPHTEFPDMPSNQVLKTVSVITSTGTIYQPFYISPLR
jgi:hypothetical protein